MADIDFYTNPMSRGQIARWALHEAGASYKEHIVGYGPEMKSQAYRAINPMGKVPAIVHEGRVVTEAAAICLYLAEAFPECGLKPETLDETAAYLRWAFFGAGPVEQAVITNSMDWNVPDDPQVQGRLGFGSFEQTVATLATHFKHNDYVCGARFTMADVYVGAQVDWGLMFATLPQNPSFLAYAERMRVRDAYKAAKEIDGTHIEKMQAQQGQD